MGADRNLLFGILALQMDFISREQLVAGMNAWVLEKSKTLADILRANQAIDDGAIPLLEALVAKHLELHGGSAENSLAATRGLGEITGDLRKLVDADLEATLAHVSTMTSNGLSLESAAEGPVSVGALTSAGRRFTILRPLARGGLGKVAVARDEELARDVALKEIHDRFASDATCVSRFVLEAQVTGGLEHPGIVPVYGLGEDASGRPFYAMRLVRGDSLKDAISGFFAADGPGRSRGERMLELRKLLGRFIDVCNAIEYAHSRGILHRDLKPSNIMLGKFGETLVVDWGVAKAIGRGDREEAVDEATLLPAARVDSSSTQIGAAIGTPQYMSPEQAAGRLDQLGPASDVYSLGATLYCILTGVAPFEDENPSAILRKVRAGAFDPPRKISRKAPRPLDAICQKAMRTAPEQRYASARDLADDIEHWLGDEPVSAYREMLFERLGRWTRRHGLQAALILLLLLTSVLIGARFLL